MKFVSCFRFTRCSSLFVKALLARVCYFWSMTLKLIFLSILLAMSSAEAIIGGRSFDSQTATSDELKMASHTVVLINTENPSSHSRCTGTLLNPNIILTAAHCVATSPSNLWVVTSVYEFAVAERHAVTQIKVHEGFNQFDKPSDLQANHDLALVQFSGVLPSGFSPTTWVSSFPTVQTRFWLPVAGYGETHEGQGDSGELRLGKVTIFDYSSKQSYFKGDQSSAEGICKGDSGGPAFLKIKDEFFILGIVTAIENRTLSGGTTFERCQGISYFNSTLFYQDWISATLKLF